MTLRLALPPALLRAAAAALEARLSEPPPQPGRLLMPKRIHALDADDPPVPDGLSAAYLSLAHRLNAAAGSTDDDIGAQLLAAITDEIGAAVVLERRLIERLGTAP